MYLLAVFALNIVLAFGENQHLICKTVDDVFNDGPSRVHSPATSHTLQGPPGKRGQMGVKGEPGTPGSKGDKGLPGFADPQDVAIVVEEKMREANRELRGRIDKLEQVVTRINASFSDLTAKVSCEIGTVYRGKCYLAIIPESNINRQRAITLCAAEGGILADILNFEHERIVVNHIRSKTAKGVDIWLGMTFTLSTSTLRWSNGDKVSEDIADSLQWWSGAPYSSSDWDKTLIAVKSNSFGIFNEADSANKPGALCQK